MKYIITIFLLSHSFSSLSAERQKLLFNMEGVIYHSIQTTSGKYSQKCRKIDLDKMSEKISLNYYEMLAESYLKDEFAINRTEHVSFISKGTGHIHSYFKRKLQCVVSYKEAEKS
jgi:hypothetical protein